MSPEYPSADLGALFVLIYAVLIAAMWAVIEIFKDELDDPTPEGLIALRIWYAVLFLPAVVLLVGWCFSGFHEILDFFGRYFWILIILLAFGLLICVGSFLSSEPENSYEDDDRERHMDLF